jgi:hypothetical protein
MAFLDAPRDFIGSSFDAVRSAYRQIAAVVNRINSGKFNCIHRPAGADFTLTANAASTTLTDARLAVNSIVIFQPMTANAAAALTGLYVTAANMNNGSWVVTHANNAQNDRTYRVAILGG